MAESPYPFDLSDFLVESLRIEGIYRRPTLGEMEATESFLRLPVIELADLRDLVAVYAPGHRLREHAGMNVRVGDYIAPHGGPKVATALRDLLRDVNDRSLSPWSAHVRYETLHPFTDGNGRSGRALWLWMHRGNAPIGFLHRFYYETLSQAPGRALIAKQDAERPDAAEGEP